MDQIFILILRPDYLPKNEWTDAFIVEPVLRVIENNRSNKKTRSNILSVTINDHLPGSIFLSQYENVHSKTNLDAIFVGIIGETEKEGIASHHLY